MSEYTLLQAKDGDFEEKKARSAFLVGMVLYGHCGGLFVHDSYGDKRITEIIGNYVEVEYLDGTKGHADVESWVALLEDSNYELKRRQGHDERRKNSVASEGEGSVYRFPQEDDTVS